MMGMYLLNVAYAQTQCLPDFMQYMGWTDFPPLWQLFRSGFGVTLVHRACVRDGATLLRHRHVPVAYQRCLLFHHHARR